MKLSSSASTFWGFIWEFEGLNIKNFLGKELLSYCFRHPLCYEKQIRETFGRRCEAATRILQISVFHFFVVYLWRFSLWAFDIKISSAKKARSSSTDECINECIIHNAFKMNFLHAVYVLFITQKAFPLFFSVEESSQKNSEFEIEIMPLHCSWFFFG